uniref:Uncharacterized protein n=1 Tax=Helianthus annuus TaxID=4232 RepID=A0A251SZV0_HELAN
MQSTYDLTSSSTERWNTKGWLNKSKNGSKNRRSADSSGKSSRHTGGSIGYAERRARMVILPARNVD